VVFALSLHPQDSFIERWQGAATSGRRAVGPPPFRLGDGRHDCRATSIPMLLPCPGTTPGPSVYAVSVLLSPPVDGFAGWAQSELSVWIPLRVRARGRPCVPVAHLCCRLRRAAAACSRRFPGLRWISAA
jgi:hypothetical protein